MCWQTWLRFLCEGDRIQQFTLEGTFTGKISTIIQFGWPWSVTTMLDDQILVTDLKGKEVYFLNWMPVFESNIQFFVNKPFPNIFKFYYFINLRKLVPWHVLQENAKENG